MKVKAMMIGGGFDIGPSKVVSFHDARTDPEIGEICSCNDEEELLWNTYTLGLHVENICAFVEYNFDIMPWNIKQHTTFIKILEHYVKEFCGVWNFLVKNTDKKDDIAKLVEPDVLKDLEGVLPSEMISSLPWRMENFLLDEDNVIMSKIFLSRKKLKQWTNQEEKLLLNAAIKDDKNAVIKMLKNHGWKIGDEFNPLCMYFTEWEDHNFLEYVAKRFTKTIGRPINIEIRIGCDVPTGIRGCTFHFFDGIAKAIVAQSGEKVKAIYDAVMKELSKRNNVEIYEPGDDYSLIEN